MYRVGWISDCHLGLKSDGVDRTSEIISIFKQFIKYLKDNNMDCAILGGDIFNSSDPSEKLISIFIGIMNLFSKLDIPVYIMVGNHDAVEDPERVSCFGFVKKLKNKYKNIHLIDDIVFKNVVTSDVGPIKFLFYPHINSALMKKKGIDLRPQEYIEQRTEKIHKKIEKGDNFYVFSHLNVKGIEPASEKYLMKKSTVYLPESIINEYDPGKGIPTIIQGHIHSHAIYQNINIIGSPLFCGFGESEHEKYFLDLHIPTKFGEKEELRLVKTKCSPFRELSMDILKKFKGEIHTHPTIKKFLESLDSNSIVKFSVNITPENAIYDWSEFRRMVQDKYNPRHVFPIHPKIVRTKTVRNPLQKPRLSHDKAIKIFVKEGHRKDKKSIYSESLNIFEEANDNR